MKNLIEEVRNAFGLYALELGYTLMLVEKKDQLGQFVAIAVMGHTSDTEEKIIAFNGSQVIEIKESMLNNWLDWIIEMECPLEFVYEAIVLKRLGYRVEDNKLIKAL